MTAPLGYDIESNKVKQDLRALDLQIKSFASVAWKKSNVQLSNLLMVGGPVGLGKTEFVTQYMMKHGLDYEPISFDGNNAGRIIYENNEQDLVLLLDDKDNVIFNEVPLKMLRQICSSGSRWIAPDRSFQKCTFNPKTDKEEGFYFEGKVVIITNIDWKDHKQFNSRVNRVLGGLTSRAGLNLVEFGISASEDDTYHFACWVLTEVARRDFTNFKVSDINKILRWWAINKNWITEPSTRTLFLLLKQSITLPEDEYFELLNSKLAEDRPREQDVDEEELKKVLWVYETQKEYTARTGKTIADFPRKPITWREKQREIIARMKPGKTIDPREEDA